MGLSFQKNSTRYITINKNKGAFAIRVNKDSKGAIPRILEKGKNAGTEIYECFYGNLDGYIKDIKYIDSEFGPSINIKIEDNNDQFILQINWSNFNCRDSFIKRLPNVKPEERVSFSVFNGEKGIVFIVRQCDGIVPLKWNKENPGDLPQPTKKTVRGVDKYDFSDVDNFLFDVLKKESERFNDDTPDWAKE